MPGRPAPAGSATAEPRAAPGTSKTSPGREGRPGIAERGPETATDGENVQVPQRDPQRFEAIFDRHFDSV